MYNYSTYTTPIKKMQSSTSLMSLVSDTKIGSTIISNQDSIKTIHWGSFDFIHKRIRQCFIKIQLFSKRRKSGQERLIFGIYRVFRTSQHQLKFACFQKLKRLKIGGQAEVLKYSQKKLVNIFESGFRLFVIFMKNKLKKTLKDTLTQLQVYNTQKKASDRAKILKMYKIITGKRKQYLKFGILKIKNSRYIQSRKRKLKQIFNILKDNRQKNLLTALAKLKRNMLIHRQLKLKVDVDQIEKKICNSTQTQYQSYKDKQYKLQLQLQDINRQKQSIIQQFKQQTQQIQSKRNILKQNLNIIKSKNQQLLNQIKKIYQETNQPYTFDQICQFFYNNMLVFLHMNPNKPIKKQLLLQNLQTPLLPINIDVQKIKQENQVMNQLISQYMIMFGPKTLEMQDYTVGLPYQYLAKQNYLLHKIMMTMLNRVNMTRDDVNVIRNGIYQLSGSIKGLQNCEKKWKSNLI